MTKKKLDARSIVAARAQAKKRLKKSMSKTDNTFTKCHEAYFGHPYNWENAYAIGDHPSNCGDPETRALYFGFRVGKGEEMMPILRDEFESILKEFTDKMDVFIKQFNEKVDG